MKTVVTLIPILILFYSCGPHRVYTSGSYGTLKSYIEKQHYVDKKTTNTYISGDWGFGKHMQDDGSFDDTKILVSLNVHRNTTGRFYNYYYGLGTVFGSYHFKEGYLDLVSKGEKKAFYNINLKTGINYALTKPKIDYRFIGLELAYTNEFGPYQKKLSELMKSGDNSLIIVKPTSILSWQAYSEYVFKLSTEEVLTLGFYFGDLMNIKETEMYSGDTGFNGITVGLRFKKYTIHLVHESGQNDISSTKIGLTYKL